MTTTEVRDLVNQSEHKDYLNSLEATFNFEYANFSQSFKGITAIYEFINQQVENWDDYKESQVSELKKTFFYFESLKNRIESFLEQSQGLEQSKLNSQWNNLRNSINQSNQAKHLLFGIPQTSFLLNIQKQSVEYFEGAYQFMTNSPVETIKKKELFIGAFLTANFLVFDERSFVYNKWEEDKKTINRYKNKLYNYLSDTEKAYHNSILKLETELNEKVNSLNELEVQWESKIADVEKTYREKLKLEEPAKYWKKRAFRLNLQGWLALFCMCILILFTALTLRDLLWKTPEQILTSFFDGDKSAAIRWSIIYVTFISLVAFGIRMISRIMFSSFHLARDANERHSLTYFYLALLNDNKVDEKDRQLIMQALFSRADTGLLKTDSSPTMPSDLTSLLKNKPTQL